VAARHAPAGGPAGKLPGEDDLGANIIGRR
jgi:hypothetical protein